MRGCFKAMVAFGLVAALSGPAMAQQGRGGFGGGGFGGNLIANPGVQKELKLDDAQIEKATALAAQNREKMQANRTQLDGLEGDERTKKMQELGRTQNEETNKALAAFLKPEQVKRLKQIETQQMGANALVNPEIAKQLNVTDEQTEKVRAILADSQSQMQEARQSAGDDRQAAMQKFQDIRKEANTKAMAILTDSQKKTWKELTGEPFTVTFTPRPNP